MDESKLTFFNSEEMTTPKEGYICYLNRYWCLSEDGKIIRYKDYSWQCNQDKVIAEHLSKRLYSGKVLFLPVAYVTNEYLETYYDQH